MEYITLKNSDLNVSRVCMGGCPMGGYGWGDVSEEDFVEAIHSAIDNGVNFFDTADVYGLGQSEKTLGKGLIGRRDKAVIQTKFGVRIENGKTFYDNSPEYIDTAINNSLSRLGTDYIDIYLVHYRNTETPIEDVINKLEELKKIGKIRYYGLSNINVEMAKEILPYKGKFICCQDEYSLACRKNEENLKCVRDELCMTPMTWGSLGQGILSGKYTKDNVNFGADDRRSRDIYVNFYGEKLEKNLKIVEALKEIANNHNKTIPSCAIRFILDYLTDSVVIVGVKRIAQLMSNLEAIGWNLTNDEIDYLDRISK